MFPPGSDMGLPSVCSECVLLPLVNKETALAHGRAEYRQVKNLNLIQEERRWSQRDTV